MYSPAHSTTLFMHHSQPTDEHIVNYNSRILAEEISHFNQYKERDYNQIAEDAILAFAVREKIKAERGQPDPVVVKAVTELLRGLLPDATQPKQLTTDVLPDAPTESIGGAFCDRCKVHS